ncbi:MAG: protease inhibitor I42 family protein, partial [Christensenellales bacterium]
AVVILALLMALAAALIGCGNTEAVYGRDDTAISVGSGEKFTIRLDASPTTGYEWSVSVSDEAVVSLEKSEYQQGGSGLVGAGGTQVLVFKANKAGTATIDLVYQRSWETKEDDERLQYAVTVK